RNPGRRGVALPGLRRQRGLLLRGPSRRRRRPGAPRPTARRGRPSRRPRARTALRAATVLLVGAARLGDIETGGFATIVPPGVGRTLIHVHPDPDEIGRVYQPALGSVSSAPRFAEALHVV